MSQGAGLGQDHQSSRGSTPTTPIMPPSISLTVTGEEPRPSPTTNMADSITLLKAEDTRPPTPVDHRQAALEAELTQPDTHAECLIRLLYVFFRSHREWEYNPAIVEVVRVVYTVFASGGEIELLDDGRPTGRKSPRQGRTVHGKDAKDVDIPLNEWARHAEAETFWALVALMGEVGDIVAADSRGLHQWGVCFTRQLKWADKGLYSVLVSRPGCVQM